MGIRNFLIYVDLMFLYLHKLILPMGYFFFLFLLSIQDVLPNNGSATGGSARNGPLILAGGECEEVGLPWRSCLLS